MDQSEVLTILGALDEAKIRWWLAGGWGVNALVGAQTRPHRDLDLLIDALRLQACLDLLKARGYWVETDWLPVRIEVAAKGRGWVDIHPMDLAAEGGGTQASLDGTQFHYPPEDVHDMELLDRLAGGAA